MVSVKWLNLTIIKNTNTMATTQRTPRTEKYELGYLPKIEYWTNELLDGEPASNYVTYCAARIKYFTEKEKERQLKLKK